MVTRNLSARFKGFNASAIRRDHLADSGPGVCDVRSSWTMRRRSSSKPWCVPDSTKARNAPAANGARSMTKCAAQAAGDEDHQARGLVARSLGQQPQRKKAREIVAALAVAQPVGRRTRRIDLRRLARRGLAFQKMHLDEFDAELSASGVVAWMIRWCGIRPPAAIEQRHHRAYTPPGAGWWRVGKGRDRSEGGRYGRARNLATTKQRTACREQQCRLRLDALSSGPCAFDGRGKGEVAGSVMRTL